MSAGLDAAFRLFTDICAEAAGVPPRDKPDRADPAAIVALAGRHRIGARVMEALATEDGGLPDDVRAALKAQGARARMRALGFAREAARVAAALDAADVRHLLLKGPALAARLFDDPSGRDCKDIDVLVDPARFADACAALEALGYRPGDAAAREAITDRWSKDVALVDPGGRHMVELHRRLFAIDALLPLDFEAMWAARSTVTIGGVTVTAPGPAHDLLYLCAHGAEHAWFRLKWLHDVARAMLAMTDDDLAQAARLAEEAGCERMLAAAIALVEAVFGIAAPMPLAGLDRRSRPVRAIVALSLEAIAAPEERSTAPDVRWMLRMAAMRARLRGDLRYRMAVATRPLATPADRRMLPLPAGLTFLYLPAKPVLLAIRRLPRRRQSA